MERIKRVILVSASGGYSDADSRREGGRKGRKCQSWGRYPPSWSMGHSDLINREDDKCQLTK